MGSLGDFQVCDRVGFDCGGNRRSFLIGAAGHLEFVNGDRELGAEVEVAGGVAVPGI